jgi:DNA-binding NarL/FixJ family response regulator
VKPIRVLIADDHTVLRAGLEALLAAEADIEVVGQAEDGLDCLEKVVELKPDVVLTDINMPRCNGLVALEQIREKAPDSRVLILTMHDDVAYLRQVLASGGAGYVLKQAAGDELLSAIRTVNEGGVFLHPRHARVLVDQRVIEDANAVEKRPQDGMQARHESLSTREAEVFRLVALGHSNSEIAEMVFLSVKTIETYKARLMRKLDVHNRAELVRFALQLGIMS